MKLNLIIRDALLYRCTRTAKPLVIGGTIEFMGAPVTDKQCWWYLKDGTYDILRVIIASEIGAGKVDNILLPASHANAPKVGEDTSRAQLNPQRYLDAKNKMEAK